jgi:hypothetical protein
MAKKKPFGGRSLSSFRKSVGLDKDKSKASTTKQERDKNIKKGYREKDIKKLTQVDTTGGDTVLSLSRGDPISNFKAQETPSTFVKDLKDAYKAGLFSSGTKGKAFMEKYGLKPGELGKLRSAIDMGLGTNIKTGTNVLEDIVSDLRNREGILTTSGASSNFLKSKSGEIFEPGMKKSNMFLPYEDPQNIFQKGANLATQFNPFLNVVSGIFGSSAGMRGDYYGRNVLGLEGEELDNFAASVANDRDLYNQMMTTPEMQNYELNEFRAEANKNAMAQRRGGDPDPISGSQGDEGGESGDGTTDPGTDPVYTPPPQNYFTFFDPNLGRYRSGTYDEYLQYVTAKDGGIIQLENGGTPPNAPGGVLPQGRKEELEDLFKARREIQNLDTPTDSERKGSSMIMAEIDDRAKDISDISKEGIMMAMRDQPAKDLFAANNPDMGPALREDLSFPKKIGDSAMSLFMEAVRKSDITEGSANQFIEEALNNFVAAGIIPPNTSYNQLTDPFKDLITREAAMIAKSENMKQEMSMFRDPKGKRGLELEEPIYKMQEGKPEDFEQINPVMRDIDTRIMNRTFNRSGDMYEVADGGIIGLKDGGMNDMMAADSLMFKDPSDEGEWEYNV